MGKHVENIAWSIKNYRYVWDISSFIRLDALKYSGKPPLDAFRKVYPGTKEEGYGINPVMLSLLHSKQYKGDGTEDPHSHIDFFENICGTFKLSAFTKDEVRLKIFSKP